MGNLIIPGFFLMGFMSFGLWFLLDKFTTLTKGWESYIQIGLKQAARPKSFIT